MGEVRNTIDCLSIILHSGFFTYHLVLKNLWVLLA